MLNKALSFFDEIEYYYNQKVLDNTSLIYIAAEILNFADNNTVTNYVENTKQIYKGKQLKHPDGNILPFPENILPFSGFTWLVTEILDKTKNKKIK